MKGLGNAVKKFPLWVTKQMLFISAMTRKKKQFGEEPEPDFVGGDSVWMNRGRAQSSAHGYQDTWEGDPCLAGDAVLASSCLRPKQTSMNPLEDGCFLLISSNQMAKSLPRAVCCELRCCWLLSGLQSTGNLCHHGQERVCRRVLMWHVCRVLQHKHANHLLWGHDRPITLTGCAVGSKSLVSV